MNCDKPPPGWECSRQPGHDGPCAARPVEPELQWTGSSPIFFARRTDGVSVCFTDGPHPDDGGIILKQADLNNGIWASTVLNMTAFSERPNDWQAFMGHHMGQHDLLAAAKTLDTVRNVVRQ